MKPHEIIKREVRLRNYTLKYLVGYFNINIGALSKKLNGKVAITIDELMIFCKILNCSADYLLGLSTRK